MFRKLTAMALVAMLAMFAIGAHPALAQGPPLDVHGELVFVSEDVTSERHVGGNVFRTVESEYILTGTFAGEATSSYRQVIHPNGRFNNQGTVICECTVAGRTGTIVVRTKVTGVLDPDTGLLLRMEGRSTVISAEGELEGLRHQGSIELDLQTLTLIYSGRLHFAGQ